MDILANLGCLSKFIQFEIWLFLVGLMSSVFFLLLKKKINLSGLLFSSTGDRVYTPERLQVLLLTLILVVVYLVQVRQNLVICNAGGKCALPTIRTEYLFVLGGSHFIYLWSKLTSVIKTRRS